MAEEEKIIEEAAVSEEKAVNPSGNPEYEPHGSRAAERPGSRKYGDRKGKPGERRGGRSGLRKEGRRPEDDFKDQVVSINRISRTEKGGKHMRFAALTVIGDEKGRYGFGIAKSIEVPDAIKKSLSAARKKLYRVSLVNGTIAHDVIGEFGATKVYLKSAPEGTGIVAGGPVRAIVQLAGVQNVVSKVYGSRNPINIIRATHDALQKMKDYETVMILRGKKAPKAAKPAEKELEKEGD